MKRTGDTRARLIAGFLFWWPVFATAQQAVPPSPPPASAVDERSPAARILAESTDPAERRRAWQQAIDGAYAAGRVADSLRIRDEMLRDTRLGSGIRALQATTLALEAVYRHDYARTRRYVGQAKTLAAGVQDEEYGALPLDPRLAYLTAEIFLARYADNRQDVALAKTRQYAEQAARDAADAALPPARRRVATLSLLSNSRLHVLELLQNNRCEEALTYVTALIDAVQAGQLRASPAQQGTLFDALGMALASTDDYDGAMAATDRALRAFDTGNVTEHSSLRTDVWRMRLMYALATGRSADFAADADRLKRARAVNPLSLGGIPEGEIDALVLSTQGRWEDAGRVITSVIDANLRFQGPENPFYKYRLAMRLLFQLRDPARPVSEDAIARFVDNLAPADNDWASGAARGVYIEDGALEASLDRLMRSPAQPPATRELAFRIAELLRSKTSQGALADGAARLAAATPELRDLIEKEQALRFEQNAGRRAIAVATDRLRQQQERGGGDEMVLKRQSDELAQRARGFDELNGRLKQLRAEISAKFPGYRELVSPNIPSSQALAGVLRPNEAYVNLHAGPSAGHAFVVRAGRPLQPVLLEVTRERSRVLIEGLRASLDPQKLPRGEGELGGFDAAASHALHQAWVAPLAEHLAGVDTVYVSAGGVLSAVPWATLLTRPATRVDQARWWVEQVVPVVMPSASSLVLLRSLKPASPRRPFAAFADPAFGPSDAPRATTRSAVRARPPGLRGAAAANFLYANLPALPETLDEVRAMSQALGGKGDAILHGPAASRSAALKTDLADVSVLSFATHGLLPGEMPGLFKPGLALAAEGRGFQDSILTIDDIIQMRLNADWVVLSACNTGYVTGQANDAMSSLLRGFFSAGARTVMATHWAVESESAKDLAVGTFVALAGDPALSKGRALASVQRRMIGGADGWLRRHPFFWAAYFVSGDDRR